MMQRSNIQVFPPRFPCHLLTVYRPQAKDGRKGRSYLAAYARTKANAYVATFMFKWEAALIDLPR